EASKEEVDMLGDVTKQIEGHTICAFGEGSSWPVQGLLRHFKHEIKKRNIKPTKFLPLWDLLGVGQIRRVRRHRPNPDQ
ncbi:MAG: NADH-ubiquinone oxidoreductase-F iron-sulfur binding region domain-containing protein, partial [Flavobacteriales bacterium]